MEKPKCPPGYLLYADPATGKDKCIKTSDFYKDLEKDMGGKKGINKIIYNRSPKGRTKLAKTGGLVKAKAGISVKKSCPRGQCGTPPNCHECADNTRVKPNINKPYYTSKKNTAEADYKEADRLKKIKNNLIKNDFEVIPNKLWAKIDSLQREATKKEIKAGIKPKILREMVPDRKGYKKGGTVKSKKKK